jgi:hypothetical protein
MKIVNLLQLEDPDGYLDQLEAVYETMHQTAERTNDLRGWLLAEGMLKAVENANDMIKLKRLSLEPRSKQVYWFMNEPQLYMIEQDATVKELMEFRLNFHMSAGPQG